ncbi:polysaccharide deacetylase family protein [Streptomyces polyrhachis]|uniref:Polysaccharide deacetylase family protein n=1 Tax=Streptomyces polyrhachis TaxID=1282885 RepID=A0ABW2GFI4_9ACTN
MTTVPRSVRTLTLLITAAALLAGCGGPAPDEDARGGAGHPGKRVEKHAAEAPRRAAQAPRTPRTVTPVRAHGARQGRRVALTFDADMMSDQVERAAGGERFDNPELIATLRRLRVPSTVFMTGAWAEQYPRQARAIGGDPLFEVANHSYSHHAFTTPCYGLPAVDPAAMRADVERAFAAFRRAGVPDVVPYFRFPGGCYDAAALKALAPTGVTAVQWDVASGDAFATDAAAVADEVLAQVRPGSVVVLHCTKSAAPATEAAVRTIVPELRRRGFAFAKVSELLAAR